MLTLFADGAESLWDELLPEEVRVLPGDLARLDELLSRSGAAGADRDAVGAGAGGDQPVLRIGGGRRWRWRPTCG